MGAHRARDRRRRLRAAVRRAVPVAGRARRGRARGGELRGRPAAAAGAGARRRAAAPAGSPYGSRSWATTWSASTCDDVDARAGPRRRPRPRLAARATWRRSTSGETFDVVLVAGNTIPLLEPGTLLDACERLAAHLTPGGVVVCGFGLDADHLPGDCPVTPLADVDAAFSVLGLDAVMRYGSWEHDAFDPADGYAVTLYAESLAAPTHGVGLMRIVVLTGAGISAESGVPTFRDADGLWEGHRGRGRRHARGVRPAADGRAPLLRRAPRRAAPPSSPTPPTTRWPGSSRRSATTCWWSPRTSTTCTSAAARSRVLHMHGELRSALCRACGNRSRLGRRAQPPAALPGAAGPAALRPDVVWFGEIPYEMDRIQDALDDRRPLRLDRHLRCGLPRRRLRPVRRGARRSHPRAQPRCPAPAATSSTRPATAPPRRWCRRGSTSCCLAGHRSGRKVAFEHRSAPRGPTHLEAR